MTAEGFVAAWLADDPPWLDDAARERHRREAVRDRLAEERERAAREADAEERADRLPLQARLSGGDPSGPTVADVLQAASERAARDDQRDALGGLERIPEPARAGSVSRLPDPPEVASARQRRAAREQAALAAELKDRGAPGLGGWVAAWTRRHG